MTAIGPLSIDIYLPAFPSIEASFNQPHGTAQVTLAAFFAGLAVGQLAQGTLADRFGRRGPLLLGLAIYTLGSAGCALSPDMTALSVMRAVAAFGASASMVIPRAVVRDCATGHAAARMMSQLMLVMGVAPILAPVLGAGLLRIGPWQLIFWTDVLYGLVCLLCVWRFLPETLPAPRRARSSLAGILSGYGGVLRERGFLAFAGCGGFAMFGLFAFIGGSPPVFIDHYHLGPVVYGVLFGTCAAGFIVGSQVNPGLVRRLGAPAVLRGAVMLYLAATLVLAALSFAGGFGPAAVVLPVMLALGCLGLIAPNSAVGALSAHGLRAGSASAVMGTLQFALAAASGTIVGWLTDGTARPMAVLMVFGAVFSVLCERARPKTRELV